MTPEQFEKESGALLDRFGEWLDDPERAALVRPALNYKRVLGDPYLTHWVAGEVDELLFDHLPNLVSLDEQQAEETLEAIARFIEFLEAEGALREGSDAAEDLAAHLRMHRDDFKEAMTNPDADRYIREMLPAMIADGVDIDDPDAVDDWLTDPDFFTDEFEDDELFEYDDESGIELPPRPPVDEELAKEAAAAAPLLRKVIGLAEFIGEGRPLTKRGNLKLTDARLLVEQLDTGDSTEYELAGKERTFRSASQLIWLDLIVWVAHQVGAVTFREGKLAASESWLTQSKASPLLTAEELARLILGTGPLTALIPQEDESIGDPRIVIDAAGVSVLAGLYQQEQAFDDLVASLVVAIPSLIPLREFFSTEAGRQELPIAVQIYCERMVRVLVWTGLITWSGAVSRPDDLLPQMWSGGTMAITPFGEWLVQGSLTEDGVLHAPVLRPLAVTLDDSPEQLVDALAGFVDAGPSALEDAWAELGGYEGLPEQLWRVDSPDTAELLEALGQTLPDKKTAKAARKALLKHRSWMAARN